MTSNTIANGILKALAIVVGVFLVLYFLYKIQVVLVYIAIAAVVTLLGRPIVRFLKRRLKFKNSFAVIVTISIMIGLVIGLISIFIPLIEEQATKLSLLNIEELQGKIESLYAQIREYLSHKGVHINESITNSKLFSQIDYSIIPNFFNSLISGFGNFSMGLLSVLFISFFLLKDSQLLQDSIMAFVPDSKESRLAKSFEKIKDLLSRYFAGLLLQLFILFVIYTVALLIFGIDNAIAIAFLCALINIIPYVGPLLGAALMIVLCMTSNITADFSSVILPKTLGVMAVFLVAQLIDNFLSQPLIFSNSVKSHPLEIFLVIIIWGILFGIVGMIVAVPSYTALKVIAKEFLSENKIVKSITKDM
ncbi:putative PurR-regulated permease PerM [Kordia periserrulae]|uniref:Putative PurR-regulated permease PerM n=1 Tax=Kordia periserrulae TaxID=701523 RepID=A0A2T6C382_9FLAO|nr:AI-2E family transporter [Kordia periserrulae]PTX62774.1 putative PurR-regulated permease PerM [Kordia periserrulae]